MIEHSEWASSSPRRFADHPPEPLPRVDVGYAVITNPKTGRVLMVCNRRSYGDSWSLPGGSREPGETLEQTVAREVAEETGLVVEVGGIVAVGERIRNTHALIVTFSAVPVGGSLALQEDEDVVALEWATVEVAAQRMPWYPGGVEPLVRSAGVVHYSEFLKRNRG